MHISPDEWRRLFDLRDDLEASDRALMRRFIKYVEHLERTVKEARALLLRKKGDE